MIDADPDHPIAAWGTSAQPPDHLSIIVDVYEDNIIDRTEKGAA